MKEAHASDGPRPAKHVEIEQPTTFSRRLGVAQSCSAEIELKIPMLVDDMENSCATAFNALPDRLFILGADGKIAYRGDRGPRGFDVEEMEQALEKMTDGAK